MKFLLPPRKCFYKINSQFQNNMRSTLYWLSSTAVAVLSMKAMAGTNDEESNEVLGPMILDPSGVSESSKTILLGIGIMAVAYTYRCAWLNHRPD